MIIDLTELFETQRALDAEITRKHPVDPDERIKKVILALLVELGETLNELPTIFKFWSNKTDEREKALVELVDSLHFILSIGNFIEYKQRHFELGAFYVGEDITEQFLVVFGYAADMLNDNYYDELLQTFLHLGDMLGFSWEEIEQAYRSKNATNWERQAHGY